MKDGRSLIDDAVPEFLWRDNVSGKICDEMRS
jgi:hypothetical protein